MSDNLKPLIEEPVTALEHLKVCAQLALERPGYQEPTFRCPRCCDTKYLTRLDSQHRVYGSPCGCLLDERANKPKIEAVRFRGRERERPIEDGEGMPF